MNIIKINNDFVNMFDECYLSTEEFETFGKQLTKYIEEITLYD